MIIFRIKNFRTPFWQFHPQNAFQTFLNYFNSVSVGWFVNYSAYLCNSLNLNRVFNKNLENHWNKTINLDGNDSSSFRCRTWSSLISHPSFCDVDVQLSCHLFGGLPVHSINMVPPSSTLVHLTTSWTPVSCCVSSFLILSLSEIPLTVPSTFISAASLVSLLVCVYLLTKEPNSY